MGPECRGTASSGNRRTPIRWTELLPCPLIEPAVVSPVWKVSVARAVSSVAGG